MPKKNLQKLELTWIGKNSYPQLEPRILIEDALKSHHATKRHGKKDIFDNALIHGDNLLALKALEQEFSGRVKCIYIDPPYNTGNAFKTYDDGKEHSLWLGLMRDRIILLHKLLSEDGVFFVQIDDCEMAYLKVLLDEVFGRENFVANLIWRKKAGGGQDSEFFAIEHEYILVYKKRDWQIIDDTLPPQEEDYSHLVNGRKASLMKLEKWGTSQYREDRPSLYYSIKDPDGRDFFPMAPDGRDGRWRKKPENLDSAHIHWVKRDGKWKPYEVFYYDEADMKRIKIRSMWTEYGNNTEATNEIKGLFGMKSFDTPKPEFLIQRILTLATNPGDLVLDSFLGSGTTAAVAHKMGRRWIGVELGDHCYTHCKVRLDKVIDGEDPGGITKSVGWKGGGGYRFYELAPTFITKDQWGQEVINRDYNPAMLAEAVCKLEGYVYSPSQDEYFIHGHATEKAFIYVTTNFMRKKNLAAISERLGEGRHLLICCKAFDKAAAGEFDNLTVRKIPDAVLNKCEWGHDDYSLNVANLPMAKEEEKIEQMELL